jgi:hypothetical protein
MCAGAHPAEPSGEQNIGAMSGSPSRPTPPLEDAILAWDAAVASVLQETGRIASGAPFDPVRLAELRAVVEAARQHCEALAARVDTETKEDPL